MIFNITEEDINQWAETRREAESVLPDLVRRLICSIVKSEEIMHIRFPAYKAVNSAGLDGVLETKNSTIFSTIPISAWEFSIRKDVRGDLMNMQKNILIHKKWMQILIAVNEYLYIGGANG